MASTYGRPTPAGVPQDIAPKLRQYQLFLSDVLRPDLQRASELRTKLQQELQEYDDLEKNLAAIKQDGCKPLKTLVDLGSEVYCQARAPDTSRVFINVGLGFHVEVPLDEAPRVIGLRREAVAKRVDSATAQCAKIRAHIKLVEGGLMELMNLKS